MSNVILIGMPGCGKSSEGVLLAKVLKKDFVDTDLLIQNVEGMTLQQIIDIRGNAYFRDLEKEVLLHFEGDNYVVATGGSAVDAINSIKKHGGKNIKFMCIIAAPEGIEKLAKAHPDIEIYVGCVDRELNDNAYILPGLGDAGDRIFGTK